MASCSIARMDLDVALPLEQLNCRVARLRAWQPHDLDSLVANASNENVSRGLADRFPYPYTGDDGRAWLARAVDESDRAWAVEIDGAAVGGVSLHPARDASRDSAELGYWLGERYWGRGIMTAILCTFAPEAMRAFGVRRLHATVYANNPASARVLEKAGFTLESVRPSALARHGARLDVFLYVRGDRAAGTGA